MSKTEVNRATCIKFLKESGKRSTKETVDLFQKEMANYARKLTMRANNIATLAGNKTILTEHMQSAVSEFSELVIMPEEVQSK